MNKQEIIEYCLTFPDAYEDYPFDEIWTVMRHRANRKSFAFIYEHNGQLRVNIKCDPIKADFLRQIFKDVIPGYHMNKQYWNTVVIGGDVPDSELYDMIQHSYDLIKPKLKKQSGVIIDKHESWPENLYYAIFGNECGNIPDDAVESVEYVLNMLSEREKLVILARFRDKKTFVVIGNEHGISSTLASQIRWKALTKLRHPARSRYLTGLTEQLKREKIIEVIIQEKDSRLHDSIRDEHSIGAMELIDIMGLDLSSRTYNCLRQVGINTLADLVKLTMPELENIRNLGRRSCEEILTSCEKYGIVIEELDSQNNVREGD